MGTTSACFHDDGNTDADNERLKSLVRGATIELPAIFSIAWLTRSGPLALLMFRHLIRSSTSFTVMFIIERDLSTFSSWEGLGTSVSLRVECCKKNSLNNQTFCIGL